MCCFLPAVIGLQMVALSHQISLQRARIAELEADLSESESRRKRAAAAINTGGAAAGNNTRSLREAEEQYLKEERLKDDLDLAKRQKLELEAALLDRDARAIESKFDLEASALEVERLRRRVKELEHAYKGLSVVSAHGGVGGGMSPIKGGLLGTTSAGAGGGGKKEQELEGVVEAMKRVVDKLKTENDRLKKGAGAGAEDRRYIDLERKFQNERKHVEQLEEENKVLLGKMKGHEESSQKIVQRQQQVAVLRRQLKSKEDEFAALREQSETLIVEKETLKKRAAAQQDRINELEVTLHKHQQQGPPAGRAAAATTGAGAGGNGSNSKEVQEIRAQSAELSNEVNSLRAQLTDLRKANAQLVQQATRGGGGGGGAGSGGGGLSAAEAQKLQEENAKLRHELSSFDLDFFDEIENLKFAHAEAVRKLRMYENAAGGADFGGGSSGGGGGDWASGGRGGGGGGGGRSGGAGRLGSNRY
jgi:chromosome segregation ATPase